MDYFTGRRAALVAATFLIGGSGGPAASEDLLSLSRLELLKRHVACNTMAEAGVMDLGTVAHCAENFLALKLKFLHGSDLERYRTLSPATQKLLHDAGYASYRAWRHSLRNSESVLRAITPVEAREDGG